MAQSLRTHAAQAVLTEDEHLPRAAFSAMGELPRP